MSLQVTLLDPVETESVLAGSPRNDDLRKIADGLSSVVDSEASVFVAGMGESNINALRTKMARRGIRVTVHKTKRNGQDGHVLMARSIK